MRNQTYWDILERDILKRKTLIVCAVFVGILCFGFTITNFSIGVDDMGRDYYLYSDKTGNLVQQGRLLHLAINYLSDSVAFIPFFTEFTGASLYVLSAVLYCALFQYITDSKLSTTSLTCFSCIYISSSILVEKFIFQLDVIAVMLSYCLSVIALMFAFRFVKEKKIWLFVKATLVLAAAIGSYESFVPLYFCGVFVVFILEIIVNKENKTFRELLYEGLWYAAILCTALAIYYRLVKHLQLVTDQYDNFTRYGDVKYDLSYFKNVTIWIAQSIKEFLEDRYVPILVFCFFSIVGVFLIGCHSIRRKNIWLFFCYAALWFGNFIIHYANGFFMCRASQTFCLFVGIIALLLLETVRDKTEIKRLVAVAVALLVFWQSADMNHWFYIDHIRYKKETFVIDTIATKLMGGFDVSKPVVFTNPPENGYLNTHMRDGGG